MKKLQLIILALFLTMVSCTTSKVERQTYNEFRGDWTLSQVVNDQGTNVALSNLFGKSSLTCLEGSSWHLIANNNSGNYVLDGAGCDTTENKIKWFVEEDGVLTYFWFKNLEEGVKAKNSTTGYKMQIISIDENQAHLMHEVPFEGKKMKIHFYFNKK